MKTLNEFANWVGFAHFEGMAIYFLFLGFIAFVVYGIYNGQKASR